MLQAIKWIIGLFKKNKKEGDEDPGEFTKDDVPDVEQDWVDAVDLSLRNANAKAVTAELALEDSMPGESKKKGFFNKVVDVFENINPKQAQLITDVASGLLAKKSPKEVIVKTVASQLSFLNQAQKDEVINSVSDGGYAVDYDDGLQFGFDTKQYGMQTGQDGAPNTANGGGARGGFCDCGPAQPAVAGIGAVKKKTALQVQHEMNSAYASKNYEKAIKLYRKLQVLRAEEGLPELVLHSLEKRSSMAKK